MSLAVQRINTLSKFSPLASHRNAAAAQGCRIRNSCGIFTFQCVMSKPYFEPTRNRIGDSKWTLIAHMLLPASKTTWVSAILSPFGLFWWLFP